jgi:tetratricopeptide (TPR) repeat protein
MDPLHPYVLRAAIVAIAVGFSVCAAAAAPVEHVSTQTELAPPAAGPKSSADVDAALARVNAARSRADTDPLALENALTALGDASLNANQYATAEAAYNEALQLAEQHAGRESERVLAPLLGLGNALSASGRNQDAAPRLQRALAIQRSQYGLFDMHQQGTLKTLAASLTALDRMQEAQDLMIYRARVAEKAYGEADPKVVPALCDLGDWFAENGKARAARMAFQVALDIVISKRSSNDLLIVEPLRGVARTYMRRQSYPEAWLHPPAPPVCSAPGQGCPFPYRRFDAWGKRIVEARKLDKEGEYALQRALRIVEADLGAPIQARIDTLIQLGDWYQIKKSPREALPYYQRASQLIRTTPGLSGAAATALDIPVRVSYPTPEIVAHVPVVQQAETRANSVQVEFTVAADGSVADARIVEHDTRDRYADDILDAVRDSRFRPKFVDGEAVATSGVTYREVFWTAKPRT